MTSVAASLAVSTGFSAAASSVDVFVKLYDLLKKQPHQLDISDKRSPEAFEAVLSELAHSRTCDFSSRGKVWALHSSRENLGGNHQKIHLNWVPGQEPQKMTYDGVEIIVSRIKELSEETLRIQTKDLEKGPGVLRELVKSAMESWENQLRGRVRIYAYSNGWKMCSSLKKRMMNSMILVDPVKQVRDEITTFFQSRSSFEQLSVPWRRGYLFWGVPGTGKSSFVMSLASELERDIFVLEVNDHMSNELFRAAFRDVPEGCIVLMEDIDTAKVTWRRELRQTGDGGMLTLSTMLNELDGVTAKPGRLVIMTTNRAHVLDDALVRPGRVDRSVEFPPLSYETFQAMVVHFGGHPSVTEQQEMYKWYFQVVAPDPSKLTLQVLQHNDNALAETLYEDHYHLFFERDPLNTIPLSQQLFDLIGGGQTAVLGGVRVPLAPAHVQGVLLPLALRNQLTPFNWPMVRQQLTDVVVTLRVHAWERACEEGEAQKLCVPSSVEHWMQFISTSIEGDPSAALRLVQVAQELKKLSDQGHALTLAHVRDSDPAWQKFLQALPTDAIRSWMISERHLLLRRLKE